MIVDEYVYEEGGLFDVTFGFSNYIDISFRYHMYKGRVNRFMETHKGWTRELPIMNTHSRAPKETPFVAKLRTIDGFDLIARAWEAWAYIEKGMH